MNKDLMKFALVGIAAGFCLSAKDTSAPKNDKEIAMAKCSKDKPNASCSGSSCNSKGSSCSSSSCNSKGSNCSGSSSCSSNECSGNGNGSCSNSGDQSNASSQMKNKRKSAAQKVVQGK